MRGLYYRIPYFINSLFVCFINTGTTNSAYVCFFITSEFYACQNHAFIGLDGIFGWYSVDRNNNPGFWLSCCSAFKKQEKRVAMGCHHDMMRMHAAATATVVMRQKRFFFAASKQQPRLTSRDNPIRLGLSSSKNVFQKLIFNKKQSWFVSCLLSLTWSMLHAQTCLSFKSLLL